MEVHGVTQLEGSNPISRYVPLPFTDTTITAYDVQAPQFFFDIPTFSHTNITSSPPDGANTGVHSSHMMPSDSKRQFTHPFPPFAGGCI